MGALSNEGFEGFESFWGVARKKTRIDVEKPNPLTTWAYPLSRRNRPLYKKACGILELASEDEYTNVRVAYAIENFS